MPRAFSQVGFFLFIFVLSIQGSAQSCAHLKSTIHQLRHQDQLRRNANLDYQAYDLVYHRMVWEASPNVFWLKGSVTSYFIIRGNQDEISFNLRQHLGVDSVTMRGAGLSFQHNNDILTIKLPKTYTDGELDSLTVYYQGNPTQGKYRSYFIENHKEGKVLATQSEPYGASDWWPCKEDLNDKFDSCDVFIITDTGYLAGGPGSLKSQSLLNDTQIRYNWQHRYPSNFYLIALAISNYEVIEDSVVVRGVKIPLINYVYPQSVSTAIPLLKATAPVLQIFDSLFGEYPYLNEKYGHMQWNKNGGMEHATMSSMGGYDFDLLSHELAHQWFGNKVTCSSWQDIWINESFATYLNSLAYEFVYGKDSMAKHLAKVFGISKRNNELPIYVTDTTSLGRIFNQQLSYNKGSMILHTLRFYVGDSAFFEACRNFLNEAPNAFRSASTENLVQHFEAVTDKDVRTFINHFYYGVGYPIYLIRYQNLSNGLLRIEAAQSTSNGATDFFHHSIPLLVKMQNGKDTLLNLEMNQNLENFEIFLPSPAQEMLFNHQYQVMAAGSVVRVEDQGPNLVEAYPNPNGGILTIESNKEVVQRVYIYSTNGQLIEKVMFNSLKAEVDIAQLKAGMLILVIETENGSYVKKIDKI